MKASKRCLRDLSGGCDAYVHDRVLHVLHLHGGIPPRATFPRNHELQRIRRAELFFPAHAVRPPPEMRALVARDQQVQLL